MIPRSLLWELFVSGRAVLTNAEPGLKGCEPSGCAEMQQGGQRAMCLFNRLKCANKCRLINLGGKQKNETFEFFDLSVKAKVYAAETRFFGL
jgi:hypothetical protein